MGDERIYHRSRVRSTARYTSAKKLLIDFMEEDGSCLGTGKKRAGLDLWRGWLAALLHLDTRNEKPFVRAQFGERYLLTGKECPQHCGQNKFEMSERGSVECFMTETCCGPSTLLLYLGSQNYVFYPKRT